MKILNLMPLFGVILLGIGVGFYVHWAAGLAVSGAIIVLDELVGAWLANGTTRKRN